MIDAVVFVVARLEFCTSFATKDKILKRDRERLEKKMEEAIGCAECIK